jgi:nitric oxide reductase NorE protein
MSTQEGLSRDTTDPTRAPSDAVPVGTVPGEPGVWVFILGDLLVFAVLFVTYLAYRASEPAVFAASQESLNAGFGALNTIVLLLSSLLVAGAVRRLADPSRTGRDRPAERCVAGAILLGLAFSAVKVIEYSGEVRAGLTPMSDDFFLCYFMFTGLHWFHVLIGMVVLGVVLALARRDRLSARQRVFIVGGACFWHMVDLLWLILFPLFYLAR